MFRACLPCLPFLFLATPASAHVGHLGEVAGHDHWVAGAAIGAAVAVGVWGWFKDRQKDKTDEAGPAEGEAEADSEEAAT